MEFRVNLYEEEEYFEVYCPQHGWLELGELIRLGEVGVHCVFCNAHLGYIHDIPDKFRLIRG